jgi:hypothetical protein
MRLGKFPIFFLLVAVASIVAACFGALHNQLSYSVGPDYFESLKFAQYGVSDDLAPRVGAALVGVQANWWMGAVIGLPAFLYGLFVVPRAQSYLAAGLGAIGTVFLLATFAALLGLVGGLAVETTGLLDAWLVIPEGVDRRDFIRAGFMHDAGYAAGVLGALVAFWPMRRARAIDHARAA